MFEKELISSALQNTTQLKTRNLLIKLIKSKKLNLVDYNCPISKNKNNIIISKFDRYGLPIEYSFNKDSGLIYSSKNFSEESFFKFYNEYYRKLYHGNVNDGFYFQKEIKRGERLSNILNKNFIKINDKDLVLEIGCGSGGVLKALNHKNSIGFDLDKNLINYGKMKGLNLIYEDLKNIQKILKQIPKFIICSHVIEHIPNVLDFLKKLKIILNKDSLVYFEVPDPLGKLQSHQAKFINELHAAHFSLFNKNTLNLLLYNSGFKIIDIETDGKNISSLSSLNSHNINNKSDMLINPNFKNELLSIDQAVLKKYPFYNQKELIRYLYLNLKSKICFSK